MFYFLIVFVLFGCTEQGQPISYNKNDTEKKYTEQRQVSLVTCDWEFIFSEHLPDGITKESLQCILNALIENRAEIRKLNYGKKIFGLLNILESGMSQYELFDLVEDYLLKKTYTSEFMAMLEPRLIRLLESCEYEKVDEEILGNYYKLALLFSSHSNADHFIVFFKDIEKQLKIRNIEKIPFRELFENSESIWVQEDQINKTDIEWFENKMAVYKSLNEEELKNLYYCSIFLDRETNGYRGVRNSIARQRLRQSIQN